MYSADHRLGEQRVVVYTDPRDGSDRVYDTAYSNEEQTVVIAECTERYGHAVKARAVYAKDRPIGGCDPEVDGA